MNFSVKFASDNKFAINLPGAYIGLAEVDYIRKELNIPKFDLSRIEDSAITYRSDPVCEITEEVAKKTCHYEHTNYIRVKTPFGRLNEYCFKKVIVKKSNETGEILTAQIGYAFLNQTIVKAWLKAGAPIHWEE